MNRLSTFTYLMKLNKFFSVAGLLLLSGVVYFSFSGFNFPGKKLRELTVAFYNVENLFDLEDDPKTNDQEFLPDGSYGWTQEHLDTKLKNLAKVISELGDEDGPEVLGVCEVENKAVLDMLVAEPALKKHGYKVLHKDSPDQRGIDCAMLYKEKVFAPLYVKTYSVNFPENPDITTRSVFLVKGLIEKSQEITFIVNHWPSRRGGSEESSWKRERAASVVRGIVDSIMGLDKFARIVIMGDLNDEPIDKSVSDTLGAAITLQRANVTGLYNTMAPYFEKGGRDDLEQGTLMYKRQWDLFDHMIVSTPMMDSTSAVQYIANSSGIYHPQWMQVPDGDWKTAPRRSHISRKFYPDGFSDHFPVYIRLQYEK